MKRGYDTDLSDEQWELVRPLVEAKTGRKARVSRRQIVNAILYLARTGCQWRNMPNDLPNWSTVYSCYHRWSWNGTLDKLHAELRAQVRSVHGKSEQPTAQKRAAHSAKASSPQRKSEQPTTQKRAAHNAKASSPQRKSEQPTTQKRAAHSGYRGQPEREGDLKRGVSCLLQRGYDGAKRLSGRKRFVVCEALGLWLEIVVLPASVPERKGAEETFWHLAGQEVCANLETVWADGGFEGQDWQQKMEDKFGFIIEIVKRDRQALRWHGRF